LLPKPSFLREIAVRQLFSNFRAAPTFSDITGQDKGRGQPAERRSAPPAWIQ